MSDITDRFWQKRHRQLYKDIDAHAQHIYTYSVLLSKSLEDYHEWTDNKDLHIYESLKKLNDTILTYFIDSGDDSSVQREPPKNLKTPELPVENCQINPDTKEKNQKEIFKSSEVEDVEDEVEVKNDEVEYLTDNYLTQMENDQIELDKIIDERRKELQKNQEQQYKPENEKPKEETVLIDDKKIRSIHYNPTPPEPAINALLRISNSERESLYKHNFLQAKKNVQRLKLDLPQEEIDKLIYKEADRLLELYIKTN